MLCGDIWLNHGDMEVAASHSRSATEDAGCCFEPVNAGVWIPVLILMDAFQCGTSIVS